MTKNGQYGRIFKGKNQQTNITKLVFAVTMALKAASGKVIGNQVKVLSDPVTVKKESACTVPLGIVCRRLLL